MKRKLLILPTLEISLGGVYLTLALWPPTAFSWQTLVYLLLAALWVAIGGLGFSIYHQARALEDTFISRAHRDQHRVQDARAELEAADRTISELRADRNFLIGLIAETEKNHV